MEDNIVESVKNNVLGTWNLLELSGQSGVETFIQISTDKAVNPTSVIGVSKRIAEMAVRHINPISRTRFIVVRFGNVLGFMTIPEAVQLVLQAEYFGKGGERYPLYWIDQYAEDWTPGVIRFKWPVSSGSKLN